MKITYFEKAKIQIATQQAVFIGSKKLRDINVSFLVTSFLTAKKPVAFIAALITMSLSAGRDIIVQSLLVLLPLGVECLEPFIGIKFHKELNQ